MILKERINNIKTNNRASVIAQHVNECKCTIQEDHVRILTIEDNGYKRKIKEALYINLKKKMYRQYTAENRKWYSRNILLGGKGQQMLGKGRRKINRVKQSDIWKVLSPGFMT